MISNKKSEDTDILNKSLQQVARGTGIVFIGSLIGLFFGFIGRIIIARHWTESEFGIFTLAFSILSICAIISTLGFQQGVTRSIAYSRGKKDYKKIEGFISSSIYFSIIASILIGLILFLLSKTIAIDIFHESRLIIPLKIFSIGLPFFALIEIIVSIYRGYDQVKPAVYFRYMLLSVLFPVFLILIIILDQSFEFVFYVYIGSLVITFVLLAYYSIRRISSLKSLSIRFIKSPEAKELVIFSLPLLGTVMLQTIIIWTDTLMLGSFMSSANVGVYNVSSDLARFISFPLNALLFIYMPIIAGLYAKRNFNEIRINFSIITKWLCSATLPLFLLMFLFSESIIEILYGSNYVPGATALRIVSLGIIINNFVGPCGVTIVAMGRSKFIMFATLFTAILNIILNAILIPFYGIVGAAIASGTSIVSINLIKSWKLYSLIGVHPLSRNLIKPTIVTVIILALIYILFLKYLTLNWLTLFLLIISFYIIYLLVFIVTKSIDKEDLKMLQSLEKKPGGFINLIRKFLTRFT